MFKRIVTLVIASCFAASYAYAETSTEISGEYSATGTYMDENNVDYQYYSHELDIFAKIKNEATTLTTEFGITDTTWGDINEEGDDNAAKADMELDRCWITHNFDNGFKLDLGKMTGGTWGTMLGNKEDGYYRVKGTMAFADTTISGFLQKNVENGETNPDADSAEKDDSDAFALRIIHKVGDIELMPAICYTDDSSVTPVDNGTKGTQTLKLAFAAIGKTGPMNFETEVNYIDVSSDYGTEYSIINVWADANMDFGPANGGIAMAYGTEDKGKGLGTFGNDFTPMVLMDNDDGTIANLGAMMLVKLYASAEPVDKLTTGCAFAYGDYEKDAYYSNKTNIMEFNITADYAITEALTYSVNAAYADVEALDDDIIQFEHEMVFTF